MKRIRQGLTMLISSFVLFGCGGSKFLERPSESVEESRQLAFWITQRVTGEDFKDCTYLPGWFGASGYLDSRYQAVDGEAPEVHVTYVISGYPDCADDLAVTQIDITDPNIVVYGLTMNSSEEEITSTMCELGFSKTDDQTRWKKNNCYFKFSEKSIFIVAPSTNNSGIVY